jgi:hypothetical protein
MFRYINNRKENQYLNIFNNKFSKKIILPNQIKINKVIVFDLDETIGSFNELILLWIYLEKIKSLFNLLLDLNQDYFNNLLDLYPEFVRYGMLTIFEFLNHKKKTKDCHKIFIYTNNIYSKEFPEKIKNYIDYKLNTTGFIDKNICAFKINNVIIEHLRTTYKKTYTDFIRCSILPKTTEICFIDNTYYNKMKHDKIYYIQPRPYFHNLDNHQIIERFINSHQFEEITKQLINDEDICKIKDYLYNSFSQQNVEKKVIDMEIDILVTQKMLYHIKDFFYLTTRKAKTKKIVNNIGRFTRKKHVS